MNATNKYIALALLASSVSTAMAQDTYDAQNFTNSDLNGTARFVGMGGALGALGGDLSVMGTNPAGIGLYKRNDFAITLGGLFTSNDGVLGHDSYRMSLDQAGGVISLDLDNPSSKGLQFFNIGINYKKNRNFLSNNNIDITNSLNGNLSQTFQIADLGNNCFSFSPDSWGLLADLANPNYLEDVEENDKHVGATEYTSEIWVDNNGVSHNFEGVGASDAAYQRATYGGNQQVDVALSFNVSDKFFYGMSFGLYNIDYSSESFYYENDVLGGGYSLDNWHKLEGNGFDMKFGFVCRPFDDSPFRFGMNVHTPTWYSMTEANGVNISYPFYPDLPSDYLRPYESSNPDYDYDFRTPWKFGFSLGHTIGNYIALGAEYEYQDPSTAKYSEAEGLFGGRDYMNFVNQQNKDHLKGQHTLKFGAELKATDDFSIRVGYNHITSPFKDGAYSVLAYNGPYTDTSYTNWGGIDRITLGLGFRFKGGYFDVAYQYQEQKGDFFAFDNYDGEGSIYTLKPTKIESSRTHIMATLGFRF